MRGKTESQIVIYDAETSYSGSVQTEKRSTDVSVNVHSGCLYLYLQPSFGSRLFNISSVRMMLTPLRVTT